ELLLCHGMVCVVGRMRDLILQLSKSSIYSTKPSHSPVNDPQGPVKGTEKVLRGNVGGDRQYALTVFRQSDLPVPKINKDDDYEKYGVGPQYVFRCVINK
ncbi:MAG: hypothetical protein E6655_21325, partial [Klebsiella pneumoniae]|nr:hypothetical protein [Klebsiella pneumoniae]